MGLDLHYQVIPDDCQLLARSRLEPEFGSHLEFFKSSALMSQAELEYEYLAENRSLVEFVDAARQLIQQYPGIEQRNLDIDRNWDIFYYLLSHWRRHGGEQQACDEWMDKAIFGSEILNLKTMTTTAHPIRYLSPMEVYEIRSCLQTVSVNTIGDHWNPVAMRRASVYKIYQSESEESLGYLQELFGKFTAFYATVADREGVIICMS